MKPTTNATLQYFNRDRKSGELTPSKAIRVLVVKMGAYYVQMSEGKVFRSWKHDWWPTGSVVWRSHHRLIVDAPLSPKGTP